MSIENGWTGKQSAHMLRLVCDQDLSVQQVEILNILLPAVMQAIKRGKVKESDLLRVRKALGLGVLTPVVPSITLPGDTAFRVGARYVVNTRAEVPISFLGRNWIAWFGGMDVPSTASCDVTLDELSEYTHDTIIIEEVGDDVCETSPAILWLMMKHGHLSKDKWYFLYMKDARGVRRAVGVGWGDGGWRLYAYSVPDPEEWHAGNHVVSRKRLATLV